MYETVGEMMRKRYKFTDVEISEMYNTARKTWEDKQPDTEILIKTVRCFDDNNVNCVSISENTTVDKFSDILERADIGTYAVFTALTKRKPTMSLRCDSYEKIAPNQWSAPEYRIPVRTK